VSAYGFTPAGVLLGSYLRKIELCVETVKSETQSQQECPHDLDVTLRWPNGKSVTVRSVHIHEPDHIVDVMVELTDSVMLVWLYGSQKRMVRYLVECGVDDDIAARSASLFFEQAKAVRQFTTPPILRKIVLLAQAAREEESRMVRVDLSKPEPMPQSTKPWADEPN
jgi:hypothetical protein